MKNGLDRLGALLHDATRALRRRFEQRTESLGLSSAQWRLMVILGREGPSSQARLAEMLEIEPISVSRLLDRMEAGGWVLREAAGHDRRVRIVVPTEKSVSAYNEIKAIANEVYGEALTGLGEAERAALVAGLNAIVSNLSAREPTLTAESKTKDAS